MVNLRRIIYYRMQQLTLLIGAVVITLGTAYLVGKCTNEVIKFTKSDCDPRFESCVK